METISETARGHEEPFAMQFSIFLANRIGQLKELLDMFVEKNVPVHGVSIIDSADWAVIRTVFSEPGKAREILKAHGLSFVESEVLLVELKDENTLSEICGHLLRAEISVHFAYPLTIRRNDNPVMVFHLDDYETARQTLRRHGLTIVGFEDLSDPGKIT